MTEKNNFHFFADNETHTWLILNYESDQVFKKIETCTIEIDVTEQPFYCIATSEKDGITVKLYIRNELGIFVENPEVCATFQVGTEKPQIISTSNRIGAAEDAELFAKLIVTEDISELDHGEEITTVDLKTKEYCQSATYYPGW